MLGEKIGEFHGKVVGQRILPSDGLPKFETTVDTAGTIIGIRAKIMATYWSAVQADGSLYGETVGPSPTITEDGKIAAYRAMGVGHFAGEAAAASAVCQLRNRPTHLASDRKSSATGRQPGDGHTAMRRIKIFEYKST
jgi:hypothetical protein